METEPSPHTPHAHESRLTRRQFLEYTGVAGTGLIAGGAIGTILTRILATGQTQTLASYPHVQIAHLNDLHVGKPVAFDYPLQGQSCYLIRLGAPALDGVGAQGDVVAFSTTCVHMGCSLADHYRAAYHVLGPCPCHLSTYDLSMGGMPTIGDATENLPQIELLVDQNGAIFAQGVWGLLYGFEHNLTSGTPVY
ncbi:MAG TPA: arsenate reductase (azurin) small subunit [Ktedonobacteraceae bacterium]